MKLNDLSVHHPINYKCPTCGALPSVKCDGFKVSTHGPRDYHNTRKSVARNAGPNRSKIWAREA